MTDPDAERVTAFARDLAAELVKRPGACDELIRDAFIAGVVWGRANPKPEPPQWPMGPAEFFTHLHD